MPGASGSWLGVHVYHHDRQDRLLDDGVQPLVSALRAEHLIDGWFFVRHWQGGPHVRLRVRPADGATAVAQQRIDRHLVEYLRVRGSTVPLEATAYAGLAAELAAVEGVGGGIEPLRPDNTLEFVPYQPDHRWTGAAERAVDRNFTESSDITVELLGDRWSVAARPGQALAMVLAGAAGHSGLDARLLAYVDRAGGRWATTVLGARRARWEVEFGHQYERQRDRVCRTVTAVLETVGAREQAAHDVPLGRWADSVTRLAGALERTGASATAVEGALAYCSHMHTNRLGIAVLQEAYLLYVLRRALRDVLGAGPGAS